MRAFLLYVIDKSALGREEQLKEQTIGVEVLGRKPDYDPATDNIVRVRAHELRGRLAKYFASEGIHEPVVITIPKGGYAPLFLNRSGVDADTAPSAGEEPIRVATVDDVQRPGTRFWWPTALVVCLVAASAYVLIAHRTTNESRVATAPSPSTAAVRDFWTQFFTKPNGELRVVYADSSIALWQRLKDKDLDLGDYLSHKYLDDSNNSELLETVSQGATSPADLSTSLHLQTVAAELGDQVNPQFARNINADFLHLGNVVLIGSRRSNPWVEVYESNLNFQARLNPDTGSPYFFNRTPRAGELAAYAVPPMRTGQKPADRQFIQESEKKEFISYGVVALLESCGTNRLALLLEGLNEQATQASGDLVTDPQLLETLLKSIGHKPGSSVSPFEALFQITSLPGGYDDLKVLAYRSASSESCISN
jgi:hypothetical protein